MSELYLIAHKVRGEPAFDVAVRMECPECNGSGESGEHSQYDGCPECDGRGYWWIVPTSGHRAYPWWTMQLTDLPYKYGYDASRMPDGLPDHYVARSTPSRPAFLDALVRKPAVVVNRRGF